MFVLVIAAASAQTLEDTVDVVEGKGVVRLEAVLELAEAHGQWSVWQEQAEAELHRRRPAEHALPSQEIPAAPTQPVPSAGPLTVGASL